MEVNIPICLALVRHIWAAVSQSGILSTRDKWIYWTESLEGP